MTGRRVYLADGKIPFMEPGDYGKDWDGMWWVYPPMAGVGAGKLTLHHVVEHEDGTISVSPSILIPGANPWHGYLEHGEWRAV